jgi:pimeloyl-ACP methyl ester carboxylesterase
VFCPALAALFLTAALVGAAAVPADAASPAPVAAGLEWYYAQRVVWQACEDSDYECASVKVPLKWSKPAGPRITIALSRDKAPSQPAPAGSIVVNPGGPGASAIESLPTLASYIGAKVRNRYDVVAVDPRGVGYSTAVKCTTKTSQMHRHLSQWFPNTHDGRVAAKKAARAWGKQCRNLTGPLLGQVDTVSAARDLDVVRAVLGERKLHYVGWSYGSRLGAAYVELFPARVGRFVLDGAINPAQDVGETSFGQLKGFEESLRAWATDCVAQGSCPLGATPDEVLATVHALLKQVEATPMATGQAGRELTARLAFYGVLISLYDTAWWSLLTAGLAGAVNSGDGSILLLLADVYNSFDGVNYVNNMLIANQAINCLDYPASDWTQAQVQAQMDSAVQVAPTLGEFWVGNGISECAHWPYKATGSPHAITAQTKAPILVLGTTGDPATPYTNAVELTKQLGNARLLTFQAEGHTAYGRGNTCIDRSVDRYLLTGKLPRKGRVCT